MKEGDIWTQQLRAWVRLDKEVQYQMGQTWGSGIGNWDGMGLTVGYWCHHRSLLALDEVGEEAGAWVIILAMVMVLVMVLVIVKGH